MPKYRVSDPETGVTLELEGDSPPTETELVEIFSQYQKPAAEIAAPAGRAPDVMPTRRAPSLGDIGDRATGFRPQVEATGMTPEQRMEAVRTGAQIAGGFAAGPVLGAAVRGIGAASPALRALGTAIESGGFRTGFAPGTSRAAEIATRTAGGAAAGAVGAGVVSPEQMTEGALIGAAVPGVGKVVGRFMSPKGPSVKDVEAAAKRKYKSSEQAGGVVGLGQFNDFIGGLKNALTAERYNPVAHNKINRLISTLEADAALGMDVSLEQLETARRVAAKAAQGSGKEQQLGSIAVKQIDSFSRQFPEAALKDLEEARDLWTKMSRGKKIDSIIRASRRTSLEPAAFLRRKFQKLKDDERAMKAFSPEEQKVIEDLADGNYTVNALEAIGSIAPPRINELRTLPGRIGAAGYGGGFFVNPAFTAGTAAVGYGSRAAANRLALMQAARLRQQMLTGSPVMPQSIMPQIVPQVGPTLYAAGMLPE